MTEFNTAHGSRRPTRRPYDTGDVGVPPPIDLYELALNTITPLQRRILAALNDQPRSIVDIVRRTGRTPPSGGYQLGRETAYQLSLITVRNVLGWLTVKGLALCDQPSPLTWRRAL